MATPERQISADPYNRFHVDGIRDAAEEMADDDDAEEVLEEMRVDDLVRQYGAAAAPARDVHALAKAGVAGYLERQERSGELRGLFDEHDHDGEAASAHLEVDQAYEAWKSGYREELEGELADAIMEAFSDEVDGDDGDKSCPVCGGDADDDGRCQQSCERGDAKPNPARYPGAKVTLADYERTGRQDAGNTFDRDTLEYNEIDLADSVEEVFTPDNVIDPKLVRKTADKIAGELKKAMARDYEGEWLEQNEDAVEENELLPSEAFHAWLDGFIGAAKVELAKMLDDEARQVQDDR